MVHVSVNTQAYLVKSVTSSQAILAEGSCVLTQLSNPVISGPRDVVALLAQPEIGRCMGGLNVRRSLKPSRIVLLFFLEVVFPYPTEVSQLAEGAQLELSLCPIKTCVSFQSWLACNDPVGRSLSFPLCTTSWKIAQNLLLIPGRASKATKSWQSSTRGCFVR